MRHILNFKKQGVELPTFAESYVQTLLFNLQAHDGNTQAHCVRVSEMALSLAQAMNLNLMEQAICLYAGLLHDVGKMKIAEKILNKPDKLTQEEYDLVKKHTEFGVELIGPLTVLPFFRKVSDAILYHHERIDGKGYFNLPEEDIPLASKIILIVDTVDAITEDRPYRKGRSFEVACDELVRCSGTQFDEQIVDCFLDVFGRRRVEKTNKAA
ncbi:MAG: HD domain-containing protein [Bdellovibrionaceae bacterium]|nr:HD domain-containing protein [Pseudobdellovibrionaceae bacterium]